MIGTSLGPYKITDSLGSGGMGEVFLAEDTRLGRTVAIKVLPAEFAEMPDRLARFEQEARAAAALNHPHIAVVHDVGEETIRTDAGEETVVRFMVQEHLDGEPLRDLLDRDRLPLKKALDLGVEICEGLKAAHAAGILHRDLKPANVFVSDDGHAKILDFGLAKLTELSVLGTSSGPEVSASPTVLGTVAGQVIGTAGYMAPEQIDGDELDQRADVFSFGCVLYEMVSGQRAFDGDTVLDTLYSITRSEPPSLADVDARLPAELQRILKKCLVKDRELRYQGTQDLIADLRALSVEVEAGRAVPVGSSMTAEGMELPGAAVGRAWRRGLPLAVALPLLVAAVSAAIAITWLMSRGEPPTGNPKRFAVALPGEVQIAPSLRPLALSPDGTRLAFVGTGPEGTRLYLRPLDQLEARPLAGTAGAEQPFFSPDGEWVGFFTLGALNKVATAGGQPLPLTELLGANFVGGAWGRDGTIVFSNGAGGLSRVQAAGGVPEVLTETDPEQGEIFHTSPSFLPGGGSILYTIYRGGTSPSRIALLDLETGDHEIVAEPGAQPVWLPTGHILYFLDGSLWVVPFDASRREVAGQAAPVVNGVRGFPALSAAATVSADGTLFYVEGTSTSADEVLVWLDPSGDTEPLPDPPRKGEIWTPRLSPDGERVAFRLDDANGRNIWVMDLERGISSLVTPNGGARSFAWTPDGEWIYYTSDERDAQIDGVVSSEAEADAPGTAGDIYRRRSDLRGPPEQVLVAPGNQLVRSISPDGEWLLLANTDVLSTGSYDIELLSLGEGGDTRPLFASEEREATGVFSPDGDWVAFVAETTGQQEIYVQSFPNLSGLIQVSRDGGVEPTWAKDMSKLYFRSLQNQDLYVVDVLPGDPIGFSAPRLLVPNVFVGNNQNAGSFDTEPGGDRLVFVRQRGQADTTQAAAVPFQVVIDWFSELDRLAPATGR